MTLTEKAAYLRGLAEGLGLDSEKPETKMFNAIMDVIDDLALTSADIEDSIALINEQLDAVDEDLDELESFVYDEMDDDELFDDDEEDCFEVECPACGEVICVDIGEIPKIFLLDLGTFFHTVDSPFRMYMVNFFFAKSESGTGVVIAIHENFMDTVLHQTDEVFFAGETKKKNNDKNN